MRKFRTLIAAAAIGLAIAPSALAQPSPYGPPRPYPGQHPPPPPGPPPGGQYYYNGRWVDSGEWRRHSSERDRWARNYQHRHHDRDRDNSAAIVAGIIGFALGAAIVGSQQQAEHARTADRSWDDYCARKYRSYDPRSRTYMGADGLRRYCQ